jgi:hypothetical protein
MLGVDYSLEGIFQPPSTQVSEELPTANFKSRRRNGNVPASTISSTGPVIPGLMPYLSKTPFVSGQVRIISQTVILACITMS